MQLADCNLSTLVQSTLPFKDGLSWQVEVVDLLNEATAYRRARIVRVQRSWQQAIFEAGLSHVTRYYPLGLELIREPELPVALLIKNVKIYRGPMLSRVYKAGRFTGQLRLCSAFIAETVGGCRFAADDLFQAAEGALSESRARAWHQNARLKAQELDRGNFQEWLVERVSGTDLDPGYMCSLAPFENLLPKRSLGLLRVCGELAAPLGPLSKEGIAAIEELPFEVIPSLIFELERAIQAAKQNGMGTQNELSAEDSAALASLAEDSAS
jgi:hypothetical protein